MTFLRFASQNFLLQLFYDLILLSETKNRFPDYLNENYPLNPTAPQKTDKMRST